MKNTLTVASCLVSLLVVGCKGPALTETEFTEQAAAVTCAYLARCGLVATTESDCVAAYEQTQSDTPIAVPRGSNVQFNGSAARDCLADYASASCEDIAYGSEACRRVYEGTSPVGGPCVYGECDATSYCRQGLGTACGTCTKYVEAGGAATLAIECKPGLYLDNGKCQAARPAPRGLGGACDGSIFCGEGLVCTSAGTCQKIAAVGESCETVSCQLLASCRGAEGSRTCLELPTIGETCAVDCLTGVCVSGTCVARAKVGESCATVPCTYSTVCGKQSKVCEARKAIGATCVRSDDDCEIGSVCDASGVCKSTGPDACF